MRPSTTGPFIMISWLALSKTLSAQPIGEIEVIPDWSIPTSATYSVVLPTVDQGPTGAKDASEDIRSALAKAIPTMPSSFVGIAPCRIVDTRGNGFGGAYGPPALSDGVPRDFILTGRCGIPANAQAASLNMTVVLPTGNGWLTVFPKGGAVPFVSTLNFRAGDVIANAALVPMGSDGGITVFSAAAGTHLLIDANGYFVAPPTSQKLCTVINHGGDWRETISVPATWTAAQCNTFRIQTSPNTSSYQLGCLSETGVSLGADDGGIPSPNCGW